MKIIQVISNISCFHSLNLKTIRYEYIFLSLFSLAFFFSFSFNWKQWKRKIIFDREKKNVSIPDNRILQLLKFTTNTYCTLFFTKQIHLSAAYRCLGKRAFRIQFQTTFFFQWNVTFIQLVAKILKWIRSYWIRIKKNALNVFVLHFTFVGHTIRGASVE